MAKLFPTEQKFMDSLNGEVVVLTRVKATSVNDNFVILPSAAVDAHILYAAGQTSLAAGGFYLGQNVAGAGIGKQNTSNIANIDGTTAGTEFLITSRHTNFKNSSLT